MIIFSTLQDALLYHYKMLLRTYSMLFIISTQHNEDTALNLEYEIMSKVPPFLVLNQKQNQLQIILIYLSFTKVKAAKLVRLDLIIFSPKYWQCKPNSTYCGSPVSERFLNYTHRLCKVKPSPALVPITTERTSNYFPWLSTEIAWKCWPKTFSLLMVKKLKQIQ